MSDDVLTAETRVLSLPDMAYHGLCVLLAHIHGEDADRIRHVGVQESYDRAVQKVLAWRAADPNPIKLREVKFSDRFMYRWNDGRLEYRSRDRAGGWWPCEAIRIEDFEKAIDLRANPYVTPP